MSKPHPHLPVPRQPRIVQQGARGRDIVAYKGGLTHAGMRPRRLLDSPTFGHTMRHEVIDFQKHHGLRADGAIGPHTYDHLINWIGDYGRRLIASMDARAEMRTVRARYVQNCLWSTQTWQWPYWHYEQWRPVPLSHPDRVIDAEHPIDTDCSGFVDLMARWTTGCPSPMGPLGFGGAGNTDTIVAYNPVVPSASQLLPGDLILYDDPGHVVVCIGYPYAVSFGAEPGPIKLDSRYRGYSHLRRFLP